MAIIDSGIDPTHPEPVGLIDPTRSVSFTTEETLLVQQEFPSYPVDRSLCPRHIHRRYRRVIQICWQQLLLHDPHGDQGPGLVPFRVSNIFRGDHLRANHGADVINISIGDTITRAGSKNYPRDAHLAVQYALVKGVSAVVIGAGNDGFDFDHGGNLTGVFCAVPGVICVVATGPTASGRSLLGPFQNIDSAAIYTNFGTSAIDVAELEEISPSTQGNLVFASLVWSDCGTTDRDSMPSGTSYRVGALPMDVQLTEGYSLTRRNPTPKTNRRMSR